MLKKISIASIFKSRGKGAFIQALPYKATILDVGCGNNSPFRTKSLRADLHYTGLDVGDYRQTKPNLADEYLVASPAEFAAQLEGMGSFDAVISSHNLEHCNDRDRVLVAMVKRLKPGGLLYLAFPSEHTIGLERRVGTLNYKDDPSHIDLPPDWNATLMCLNSEGMEVLFSAESYKPFLLSVFGAIVEPISKLRKTVMLGTWQLHGFEAIIWARKR
jgi:SAM-dependent methyltransferase